MADRASRGGRGAGNRAAAGAGLRGMGGWAVSLGIAMRIAARGGAEPSSSVLVGVAVLFLVTRVALGALARALPPLFARAGVTARVQLAAVSVAVSLLLALGLAIARAGVPAWFALVDGGVGLALA